jgi:hypothetical protein
MMPAERGDIRSRPLSVTRGFKAVDLACVDHAGARVGL